MDEQAIRQIVRQEIEAKASASRFALNSIPRHTHNGVDSPQINQGDIVASKRLSGSITMAQATQYHIGVNFNPTSIIFNGEVVNNNGSSPTIRAHCIGTAFLGPSFYLQPSTTTSVVVGGPTQNLIQSSSMFLIDASGVTPVFRIITDEGHIVDAEYSGVKARATVTAYSSDSITINVETLAAGYQIIGNWVIS